MQRISSLEAPGNLWAYFIQFEKSRPITSDKYWADSIHMSSSVLLWTSGSFFSGTYSTFSSDFLDSSMIIGSFVISIYSLSSTFGSYSFLTSGSLFTYSSFLAYCCFLNNSLLAFICYINFLIPYPNFLPHLLNFYWFFLIGHPLPSPNIFPKVWIASPRPFKGICWPLNSRDSSWLSKRTKIFIGVCLTFLILRKGCSWFDVASHF